MNNTGEIAYSKQTSPLGVGGEAYYANNSSLRDGGGLYGLDFFSADARLKGIITRTPLMLKHNLSRQYQCNIFLKREDL